MVRKSKEPTPAELRKALERYLKGEAAIDDPLFAGVGGRIQHQGFVAPDDLYLILLWKSTSGGGLKQARGALMENTPENIEDISRKALSFVQQDGSSDAAIKAVEALVELHHVEIPVATAILTLYDPTRFASMDAKAWKAVGWPDDGSAWDAGDYGPYLLKVREIAERSGLTPREVDAALQGIGGR